MSFEVNSRRLATILKKKKKRKNLNVRWRLLRPFLFMGQNEKKHQKLKSRNVRRLKPEVKSGTGRMRPTERMRNRWQSRKRRIVADWNMKTTGTCQKWKNRPKSPENVQVAAKKQMATQTKKKCHRNLDERRGNSRSERSKIETWWIHQVETDKNEPAYKII